MCEPSTLKVHGSWGSNSSPLAQRQPDPALLVPGSPHGGGNLILGGELTLARVHLEQGVSTLYAPSSHRFPLAFSYGYGPWGGGCFIHF